MSVVIAVSEFHSHLANKADKVQAAAMEKYMKNHFVYLGVKSPTRKETQKTLLRDSRHWSAEEILLATDTLYSYEEREFHYVACDLLRLRSKKLREHDLKFLEKLVLTHSWWDSVDALAGTIGDFLLHHPQLQPETTDNWMASDELWLRRVALIHQLKYREKTDWPMLKRYVIAVRDSPEFFMQKGAGWALRQYSKFEPELVRQFLSNTVVMPLTYREATKYL